MKIKVQAKTSAKVRSLVYNLLDVFQKIGIPVDGTDRKVERMAKACLAVGKIKKSFAEALSEENDGFVRTRDIISFENENYGEHISPGSYDNIRRTDLKLLIEAGIVINSSSKENSKCKNRWKSCRRGNDFRRITIYWIIYSNIVNCNIYSSF